MTTLAADLEIAREERTRMLPLSLEDARHFRGLEEIADANGVEFPSPTATADQPATTWAPISLESILAGDYEPPVPTLLTRTDGPCLLYPGRSHWVSAEPEALKTWLACLVVAEQLDAGKVALFIDFEGSLAEIIGRLLAQGVDREAIRERFIYIRPDEPLAGPASADLDRALKRQPSISIIDGVTESFSLQGLSPLDNSEVATWLELLPRRIIRAGSTPFALDHVVKDKEQRGRYAIGAQHKLAGVDVHYSMHVVEPFSRGHDGIVTIKVQKDRPGGIREYAQDGIVATLRATSYNDGHVSLSLEPPAADPEHADFRPTILMERVSRYVNDAPGASANETNVRGKKVTYIRQAVQHLIAESFMRREKDGTAWRHYVITPFSTDENEPDSSTRPDSSPTRPDEPFENSSPRPPLNKGRGREREDTQTDDEQLVQRAEELHARHRDNE